MFEHPQLAAFRAIVDTGSFEAAAEYLRVTPSAISQRIRALEERLGGPVLTRSLPLKLTALGTRVVAHAQGMARLDAELARDVGQRPDFLVSIAVNADSLATWFLSSLEGHEPLRFDIQVVDQDHSAEHLSSGRVAAAVTSRADAVAGMDVRPLGRLRYVATATPEFRDRHFRQGLTPEAFSSAPALVFSEKDSLQSDWAAARSGRKVSLPAHRLPSTRGFVEAAALGLGWGLNPLPLVEEYLTQGTLIDLAPDAPHDVALYWQSSRIGRGILEPLTQSVRRAARDALLPAEA